MTKCSLEAQFEVFNDENGLSVRITQDPDSLGFVMIKPTNEESEEYYGKFKVELPPEMALLVAEAMTRVAKEIIENEQSEE